MENLKDELRECIGRLKYGIGTYLLYDVNGDLTHKHIFKTRTLIPLLDYVNSVVPDDLDFNDAELYDTIRELDNHLDYLSYLIRCDMNE